MISCKEAVAQLCDYVEQQVSTEDAARIDEHLAACRRCCGEAEFAGELRTFMTTHAQAGIPRDVHERLDGFLKSLDRTSEV